MFYEHDESIHQLDSPASTISNNHDNAMSSILSPGLRGLHLPFASPGFTLTISRSLHSVDCVRDVWSYTEHRTGNRQVRKSVVMAITVLTMYRC